MTHRTASFVVALACVAPFVAHAETSAAQDALIGSATIVGSVSTTLTFGEYLANPLPEDHCTAMILAETGESYLPTVEVTWYPRGGDLGVAPYLHIRADIATCACEGVPSASLKAAFARVSTAIAKLWAHPHEWGNPVRNGDGFERTVKPFAEHPFQPKGVTTPVTQGATAFVRSWIDQRGLSRPTDVRLWCHELPTWVVRGYRYPFEAVWMGTAFAR